MVAHNVAFVELHDADPPTPRRISIERVSPLSLFLRQVDLRHVARDDEPGVAPMRVRNILICDRGRILRLVEDDERIVERTAAHVGQRRDLYRPSSRYFASLAGGIMSFSAS